MATAEHVEELRALAERFVKGKVRSYLEIGARNGISLGAIGEAMMPDGVIVVVDLPNGRWGSKDSVEHLKAQAQHLVNEFGHSIELLLSDSQTTETLHAVRRKAESYGLMRARPFDMVFIDADHTYDSVRADWLAYGRLAKVVVFDDIAQAPGVTKVTHGETLAFGVSDLWAELEGGALLFNTETIIAEGSKNGKGILTWNDS